MNERTSVDYWDWLPAFRWGLESQEVELPSKGLLNPTILLDGLASIVVWASSFVWRIMLWAVKAGLSSDLMEEAGKRINSGAASMEPAVMTAMFGMVAICGAMYLLLRLMRTGDRSEVLKRGVVSFVCIGLLIGVMASSRISASETEAYEDLQEGCAERRSREAQQSADFYTSGSLFPTVAENFDHEDEGCLRPPPPPRFMSAAWLLEKPSEWATDIGGVLSEVMRFTDSDDGILDLDIQQDIQQESPLDCQHYIAELNRRANEVVEPQQTFGVLQGGANIATAMSDLWVNAAYNTFSASQFGSSPLSASVYCRYLEAVSGQDPGMQLHTTVDAAAGPGCNYDYDTEEYLTGWEPLDALEDKDECKIDLGNPEATSSIWLGEWAYKILVGKTALENINQEPVAGGFREGLKYLEDVIIECGGMNVDTSDYPRVDSGSQYLTYLNFRAHLDLHGNSRWANLEDSHPTRYRACLKLAFFIRNITLEGYGDNDDVKWKYEDSNNGADRDHGWAAMGLYICGATPDQITVLDSQGGSDAYVSWQGMDGGPIDTRWRDTELWNCMAAMAAALGTANTLEGVEIECNQKKIQEEEIEQALSLGSTPCINNLPEDARSALSICLGQAGPEIPPIKECVVDGFATGLIHPSTYTVNLAVCSPVVCAHDGDPGKDGGELENLDDAVWDWRLKDGGPKEDIKPVSLLFNGDLGNSDNESHIFTDPFSNAQPPQGEDIDCSTDYPSVCKLVWDAINAVSWFNISKDNWTELPRLFSSLVLSNIIPRPSTISEKLVTKEYEPGEWFTEVMDEELYGRILNVAGGSATSYSPTLNDVQRRLSKKVSYSSDNKYSDEADAFRLSEILDSSYTDGQDERPDPSYVPGALSQIFRDPINHGHAVRIAGFWAMCAPETTDLKEVADLKSDDNSTGISYNGWRDTTPQRDVTNHYWDLREDFYGIAPHSLSQLQSNSSNTGFEAAGRPLEQHFDEPWGHVCAAVWTGAGTIRGIRAYYCSGGIALIQSVCEGFNAALSWLGIGREQYVRNDITDVRPLGGGAFQLKPDEVAYNEPVVSFLNPDAPEFGISPAADAWLSESDGGGSLDRLTAAMISFLVTIAMFALMGVIVLMVLGSQIALLVGFSMLPVILLLGAIPSERTKKMLTTFVGVLLLSLVGKMLAVAVLSIAVVAVWFMTVMAFTAFSVVGYKWAYLLATVMSCFLMIYIAKRLWKGMKEVVDRTGASGVARSVADTWGGRKLREGAQRGRRMVQDKARHTGRAAWELGVRQPVRKIAIDPLKKRFKKGEGGEGRELTGYGKYRKQEKEEHAAVKTGMSAPGGVSAPQRNGVSVSPQGQIRQSNGPRRVRTNNGGRSSMVAPNAVKQPTSDRKAKTEQPKRPARPSRSPAQQRQSKPDGEKAPKPPASAADE